MSDRTNVTSTPAVTVRPLSPSVGVEVSGLDLARPLAPDQANELRSLLAEHSLLLFRRQELAVEDQIRVVGVFGTVGDEQEDGSFHSYVSNVRADGLAGESRLPYHSDFTYTRDPHLLLSLYGEEVAQPAEPTWFASRIHAVERLPADVRARAEQLEVVHARDLTPESRGNYDRIRLADLPPDAPVSLYPRAVRSLVDAHPASGRPLLFVDEHFMSHIVGMEDARGEAFLQELLAHLLAPENTYRHDWRQGDLLIWDNLAAVHARHSLAGAGARTLRRVVVSQATTSQMYEGNESRTGGLRFASR